MISAVGRSPKQVDSSLSKTPGAYKLHYCNNLLLLYYKYTMTLKGTRDSSLRNV